VDPAVAWAEPKAPLRPVIGTVDIPSMQAQETLRLDLTGDGHVAVFASPGYGKSTFLQTLVMDLARTHSPEHLHVYLLDFGTNGLLPLRGLPHVADTVTLDDTQKTRKLVERLEAEIKLRKQRLSEHAVASLEMFERASGEVLAHVLLVVDGLDSLKGAPGEDALNGLMTVTAREGAGLGIHLVLTAGRHGAVRTGLAANIKTQMALRLNGEGEARGIVGRTALVIEDVPGRGLVRVDQPEAFQVAVPNAGTDALGVIEAIRDESGRMTAAWSGGLPESIPVIPETLARAELLRRVGSVGPRARTGVPVGLDLESVEPVGIDLMKARQLQVVAADGDRVAGAIELLWELGAGAFPGGAYVLDDQVGTLRDLARQTSSPGAPTGIGAVLGSALAELDAREQAYLATQDRPDRPSLADHVRTLDPALVVIADAPTAPEDVGEGRAADLVRLLRLGPLFAMPIVLGATSWLGAAGAEWRRHSADDR
jgi:S-DNA-T family DNA segregation ATPase FtsK/SpoIIIE